MTAKMIYITRDERDGETLIAVTGDKNIASTITGQLLGRYKERSLDDILTLNAEQKITIPEELSWIVNSDRRHHDSIDKKKEDAAIMGKNSLSFLELQYTDETKTKVYHPTGGYPICARYAKEQWPTARFVK